MDTALRSRFQFMLANAGYSVPPGRAVCALELARMETLLDDAIDLDAASVEWRDDPEPYDPGDVCTETEAWHKFESNEWTGPFGCIVTVGDATASLWGIVVGQWGTNDPYCRVVAAELASELEDDLRQAIGDARDEAGHPSGICCFPH